MNKDEIYRIVKFLAVGILIGYFGKYALKWVKDWKTDSKNPENSQEKQN